MDSETVKTVNLIEKTRAFIQARFEGEGTGHDWWHIYRVWKAAQHIGQAEGAHLGVVELAALLHDVADWKFHGGDENAGPRTARAWLTECGLENVVIDHVCQVISEVSFKGAGVADKPSSLEAMVVQDADRLDAIGAVGVARAFAYGGAKDRPLYDPDVEAHLHASFDDYKKSQSSTIHHFYEKLLLLKDRMHTRTARAIAERRHAFLEAFLAQFLTEWDGADFASSS